MPGLLVALAWRDAWFVRRFDMLVGRTLGGVRDTGVVLEEVSDEWVVVVVFLLVVFIVFCCILADAIVVSKGGVLARTVTR